MRLRGKIYVPVEDLQGNARTYRDVAAVQLLVLMTNGWHTEE